MHDINKNCDKNLVRISHNQFPGSDRVGKNQMRRILMENDAIAIEIRISLSLSLSEIYPMLECIDKSIYI